MTRTYIRSTGEQVRVVSVESERINYRSDKRRGKIPRGMNFPQYLAKYLGWRKGAA